MHPTQRRLVVALVVTLACLPLLALDLIGGHGGGTSEASIVSSDVPEPSMVVAVSPSEVTTSSTSTTTTAAPATTAAPTATTTATTAAPVTTTTTSAPVVVTTPTTAAPEPVYVEPAPAPATGGSPTAWEAEFMSCVRYRESRGDYTAVDPSGMFMGAYQIYQGGWDAVASSIGRGDLVGVRPHTAAPADQDAIALAMLRQYGTSPWGGYCG